jgi:hypothetical protein
MIKRLWFVRWHARLDATPFSLFLAAFAIPIGSVAVVLGAAVSRAISNVLSGALIPHGWGLILASAGVATLVGIGRDSWLTEYVGLRLMAFALVFYAACAYTGLGLGGIVAGSLSLSLALACWYRSRFLYRLAKANAKANAQRADRADLQAERSDLQSERAGADHFRAGRDSERAGADHERADDDSERTRRHGG